MTRESLSARTAEIDAIRFQNKDLKVLGTLEFGQFGVVRAQDISKSLRLKREPGRCRELPHGRPRLHSQVHREADRAAQPTGAWTKLCNSAYTHTFCSNAFLNWNATSSYARACRRQLGRHTLSAPSRHSPTSTSSWTTPKGAPSGTSSSPAHMMDASPKATSSGGPRSS